MDDHNQKNEASNQSTDASESWADYGLENCILRRIVQFTNALCGSIRLSNLSGAAMLDCVRSSSVVLWLLSRIMSRPVQGRAAAHYMPSSPLNWRIFRRSRLEGLPGGAGVKLMPVLRSSATLSRSSRLDSVSR